MMAQEYPVRLLCELLGCAPSSYYHQPQGRDDTELRDLIEEIALEFPCYGYRRMTAELRRRGLIVNHKRVLRIMREEDLPVQVKRYVRTTFSQHGLGRYPNLVKNLEPEGHLVWRHHLHPSAVGIPVLGSADGHLHPGHPRLASEP